MIIPMHDNWTQSNIRDLNANRLNYVLQLQRHSDRQIADSTDQRYSSNIIEAVHQSASLWKLRIFSLTRIERN